MICADHEQIQAMTGLGLVGSSVPLSGWNGVDSIYSGTIWASRMFVVHMSGRQSLTAIAARTG